jgi:hypothetical protein
MRCIFCKADSSTSRAVEHIIPESLGNTEHILPPGVVCDSCNNYFARKIEKPLLDSDYFVHARHRAEVYSKKGRIPPIQAIHIESATLVEMGKHKGERFIYPSRERDSQRFITSILSSKRGTLVVPTQQALPDEQVVSRFVGKVALETLAQRLLDVPNGLDEVVDKSELDELRVHVRRGSRQLVWPFHQRVIHAEDAVFCEEGYGRYEVLHEYTLLYTEAQELYLVLAIFGVEYTLNMGVPDISRYLEWLRQHGNKSPLYL